eukprot:3937821-Rhodomonas_salina.2
MGDAVLHGHHNDKSEVYRRRNMPGQSEKELAPLISSSGEGEAGRQGGVEDRAPSSFLLCPGEIDHDVEGLRHGNEQEDADGQGDDDFEESLCAVSLWERVGAVSAREGIALLRYAPIADAQSLAFGALTLEAAEISSRMGAICSS